MARPIGLALSDYHGVIAERGAEWTAAELLKGCSLVRYEFDHLLTSQQQFAAAHQSVSGSPIIDVSGGYEAFLASRDSAGRKQVRETERKREKLEAEVGTVEFTDHSEDQDVLATLIRWKSEQCRSSGTVDYFALPWCVQLVRRIHAEQRPGFAGLLSCLHVEGKLIAAHFAMRSTRVWHSWFPVYNRHFQGYSPGMILLLEKVRSAAAQGIQYIDLGKGMSTYKRRFMSRTLDVAEGCVEVPSLVNRAKHLRELAERWGRSSALRPLLRMPGRVLKHIERRGRYV
jgi:CelD/BcsL family acetyltransferase involved in cellulose biosynthesis